MLKGFDSQFRVFVGFWVVSQEVYCINGVGWELSLGLKIGQCLFVNRIWVLGRNEVGKLYLGVGSVELGWSSSERRVGEIDRGVGGSSLGRKNK